MSRQHVARRYRRHAHGQVADDEDDRQRDAQTLRTLVDAGLISHESAVKAIADTYDIEDVSAELEHIHTDLTADRTD